MMIKRIKSTYTTLDFNATLVPANHVRIVAAKLVHTLLDNGPPMLETSLITCGMDRQRLHIFLMFMVRLVDIFPILVSLLLGSTYRVHVVANQDSYNKSSHGLRMLDLLP